MYDALGMLVAVVTGRELAVSDLPDAPVVAGDRPRPAASPVRGAPRRGVTRPMANPTAKEEPCGTCC